MARVRKSNVEEDKTRQPDTSKEAHDDIEISVGRIGSLRVGLPWVSYVGPFLKWPILSVSFGLVVIMIAYAISLIMSAK